MRRFERFHVPIVLSLVTLMFLSPVFRLSAFAATFYGASPGSGTHEYEYGKGKYLVYLPLNYNTNQNYPVVIICFVYLGNPEVAPEDLFAYWQKEADRRGYVLLMPLVGGGDTVKLDQWYLSVLQEFRMRFAVDREQILLMGFGEGGGHYAIFLGTTHPEAFGAVGVVAGSMEGYWKQGIRFPRGVRPEFYMMVGDEDQIVPAAQVQEAVKKLKAQGYSIQYEDLKGIGHEYSDEITRKIADWFDIVRNK